MVDDIKKNACNRALSNSGDAGLEAVLPTETLLARVRDEAGVPLRKHSNDRLVISSHLFTA